MCACVFRLLSASLLCDFCSFQSSKNDLFIHLNTSLCLLTSTAFIHKVVRVQSKIVCKYRFCKILLLLNICRLWNSPKPELSLVTDYSSGIHIWHVYLAPGCVWTWQIPLRASSSLFALIWFRSALCNQLKGRSPLMEQRLSGVAPAPMTGRNWRLASRWRMARIRRRKRQHREPYWAAAPQLSAFIRH